VLLIGYQWQTTIKRININMLADNSATIGNCEVTEEPKTASFPLMLNADWRVAFDPLQWILQHRQGQRWRDRAFCVMRDALLRCIADNCGVADITQVLQLPEWHPERAAAAAKTDAWGSETPEPVITLLPCSIAAIGEHKL
jgi:hypothetical protein